MTAEGRGAPEPDVSIVVPVYNEVDSIPILHEQIDRAMSPLGRSYEVVYINDGSKDGSTEVLDRLAETDPHVHLIHFRRNFGKSPALAAGFERAKGNIVITMDADLQDDPAMLPGFLERIDAGADLVSGWKQRRHDPIGKTLPSKFFNGVVRWVSGVPLRDFNCGFKAYRIDCVRELSVYGGFHRFLPVLAGERGFRIEELVVNHRPREHGVSKFGVGRFIDGFLDLLTVLLVTRYRTRPLHFFGVPGGLITGSGLALLSYLTVLWLLGEPIGTRPLLTLGVLLTFTGVQFLAIGLVAELLVRTTLRSREIYSVRKERPARDVSGGPSTALVSPVGEANTGQAESGEPEADRPAASTVTPPPSPAAPVVAPSSAGGPAPLLPPPPGRQTNQ